MGAYNFSASAGEVPVYFDNLTLSFEGAVPVRTSTRAAVKELSR